MSETRYKNSYYGSAVVFFIFALIFIIPALQGHSMTLWKRLAGGIYVSSKQMLGAGIVVMIYSIIDFYKGIRIAIERRTLSESLENKEQRDKRQNQRVEPTAPKRSADNPSGDNEVVQTPVDPVDEQGTDTAHP